jgi:hypothetical protein
MFSLAVIVQIRSSENISNVTERVDHGKNRCSGVPKTLFLFADPLGLPRTMFSRVMFAFRVSSDMI